MRCQHDTLTVVAGLRGCRRRHVEVEVALAQAIVMLAAHIIAGRGRRSERFYRSIGCHALVIEGWTSRISGTILLERHTSHESTLRSLYLVQ